MLSRIGCLLYLLILVCFNGFSQAQLEKVIPLSPNAASIAKYGEIPVSYFTGLPGISVPVYHVKSKELELPLQLSYHASGNKVEDVASWVGLGWSLSGAPMISRSVRGIPDESLEGFFNKLSSLYRRGAGGVMTPEQYNPPISIKTIQDSGYHNNTNWWSDYLTAVYRNQTDPEADIFFYTLPNKSGKFFWDQVTEKFHTYPWTNVKISYSGYAFEIVDEDGTIYVFPASLREQTTVSGSGLGSQITGAWWASKMYDANKTDSMVFYYDIENQTNYTLDPGIKTIWGSCDNSFGSSTASTSAYTLTKILFANGVVLLKKDTAARQDLSGGYSLKTVEVYNSDSQMVKKVNFSYAYRTGSAPSNYSSTVSKRMMLTEVKESALAGIEGAKYSFLYDSIISNPHRLSTAQDYWGYYNGATSNTELVPTARLIINSTTVAEVTGANRDVDPDYSQFAILKRITFPTGGYSDFEYENNVAYNPNIPPATTVNAVGLSYGTSPPSTTSFADTFEIDVDANYYLNSNQGGAIVSAVIGNVGCDLSGGSSTCAMLTVRGLDSSNSNIIHYISSNIKFALPNGTYEIKAVFDQDPPAFESFYFDLTWRSIDSSQPNRYVGGLRIKSIKSYDGINKQLHREYKYTRQYATDTSSGDVFGSDFFIGYDDFHTTNDQYCRRIFAQNSQLKISHSGSFIGYKTVYEKIDSLGEGGLTEYSFTHEKDLVDNQSPFPPAYTMEAFRGQPLTTTYFKKQGSNYLPVSRTLYEYAAAKIFDSLSTYCVKAQLLKPAVIDGQNVISPPSYNWMFYDFTSAWSTVSKKTERLYDPADTTKYIETVTNYDYSPNHYQLVKTSSTNSRSQLAETIQYYTPDLTLSGTAEDARETLLQRNVFTAVLKQEKKIATATTEVQETQFREFHATNIVKPELIKLKIGSGSLENRVEFTDYDVSGNLQSQKKTGDISLVYIWDYAKAYPIAEVKHADISSIAYTSFEADGTGGWSGISAVRIQPSGGITGSKYYDQTGFSFSKSGLSSSVQYIVSYWSKNGSYTITGTQTGYPKTLQSITQGSATWTLYEHLIGSQTTITISGSGAIDELRLYPKGAEMSTLTYTPLVGITTQCDVNNNLTYYEYDGFGRLILIRDQDKNVLKKICYNYSGQPDSCNIYYNEPISQSFTRNNCGTDSAGSSISYSVPDGKYSGYTLAEANAKAQAEINAFGQANANAKGSCTWLCTTSNCTAANKKCVYGACETGIKVYTASVQLGPHLWECTYHYEWSDGSWSQNYTEESPTQCIGEV